MSKECIHFLGHCISEQDKQCACKRNIEVRSFNHCCSGKAIRITRGGCVFVALGIQRAVHLHHIVICGVSGLTIFFHIF